MPILSAHILPHPPLIIPAVGKGRERDIQKTVDGCLAAAKSIAEQQPETIIIISPHATTYKDYFHISGGGRALGSFARFGAPDVRFDVAYDTALVCDIVTDSLVAAVVKPPLRQYDCHAPAGLQEIQVALNE